MRCQSCYLLLKAILFVAAYAIPAWTAAQNIIESAQPEVAERAERERIQYERAKVGTAHEAAKVECYQRFSVNDCLIQARDQHNAQLADLKRQEISLNDLQRKRRGAQQSQRTEEKTSPQKLLEQAEQRGNALANSAKRAQRQEDKGTPQARAVNSAKTKTLNAPQGRVANGQTKQQRSDKKIAQKQAKQAKVAQDTASYDQRIKDAQEHRAQLQKRQQQNKKTPAASLPIPTH
jgi:hypothetical protein